MRKLCVLFGLLLFLFSTTAFAQQTDMLTFDGKMIAVEKDSKTVKETEAAISQQEEISRRPHMINISVGFMGDISYPREGGVVPFDLLFNLGYEYRVNSYYSTGAEFELGLASAIMPYIIRVKWANDLRLFHYSIFDILLEADIGYSNVCIDDDLSDIPYEKGDRVVSKRRHGINIAVGAKFSWRLTSLVSLYLGG